MRSSHSIRQYRIDLWWEVEQMPIDGAPIYRVRIGSPNHAYIQLVNAIGELARHHQILKSIQPCVTLTGVTFKCAWHRFQWFAATGSEVRTGAAFQTPAFEGATTGN